MSVFYWNLNFEIKEWNNFHDQVYEKHFTGFNLNENNKKFPDVYYIILDKYASEKVLMKYLDKDISWFTNKLKQKGFFVAADSRCNYVSTEKSLASSLNMSHYSRLDPNFFGLLRYLIKNNLIAKIFKKLNYQYVYVGYDVPFKLENENKKSLCERFKDDFLFSFHSALKPYSFLSFALGVNSLLYYYWFAFEGNHHKNVVLSSLLNLEKAIDVSGPKFVFAHIVCPHGPYIFDENGNYRSQKFDEGYVQQVEFISRKIDKIIDLILSKNKNSIILLQGDHGFFEPSVAREIKGLACPSDSTNTLFHILNAYYFPNKKKDKFLYNTVSPVNSFRILFNNYFGTNFELLKDESFYCHDSSGKFTRIDNFKN